MSRGRLSSRATAYFEGEKLGKNMSPKGGGKGGGAEGSKKENKAFDGEKKTLGLVAGRSKEDLLLQKT